jgi:hypothetical protein
MIILIAVQGKWKHSSWNDDKFCLHNGKMILIFTELWYFWYCKRKMFFFMINFDTATGKWYLNSFYNDKFWYRSGSSFLVWKSFWIGSYPDPDVIRIRITSVSGSHPDPVHIRIRIITKSGLQPCWKTYTGTKNNSFLILPGPSHHTSARQSTWTMMTRSTAVLRDAARHTSMTQLCTTTSEWCITTAKKGSRFKCFWCASVPSSCSLFKI